MDLEQWLNRRRSRRRMLQGLGIFAGASLALESGIFALNKARAVMAAGDARAILSIIS